MPTFPPAVSRSDAQLIRETGQVCVPPEELGKTLQDTMHEVLLGLPQWNNTLEPDTTAGATLAFLIQVAFEDKLPLVFRVFRKIYSPEHFYLYMVDSARLDPKKLHNVLPNPLPDVYDFMALQ